MKGFLLKAKYINTHCRQYKLDSLTFLFSARLFLFDLVACFSHQIWQHYVMHL